MKKTSLLFLTLLMVNGNINAQTGSVTVTNSTSCDHIVTMHARSNSIHTPVGCNDLVGNTFTIPAGATYTWNDPYDFETGNTYCGGTCPGAIGWSSLPVSWGYSSIDPTGSYWGILHYPNDWRWTYATIDFISCCGVSGNLDIFGTLCWSGTTISNTCPGGGGTFYATSSLGSCGPCDVTITIY